MFVHHFLHAKIYLHDLIIVFCRMAKAFCQLNRNESSLACRIDKVRRRRRFVVKIKVDSIFFCSNIEIAARKSKLNLKILILRDNCQRERLSRRFAAKKNER